MPDVCRHVQAPSPATKGRRPERSVETVRARDEAHAEIAETDHANRCAAQQNGVCVASCDVPFTAEAECTILAADAARQVKSETEGVLSYCVGVGRSAAQYVHASIEEHPVVDVGIEIAFDVEQRAQLRSRRDAR